MKRLFSASHHSGAIDMAVLILRAGISILMIHHGYTKLSQFPEIREKFMDFLGLGMSLSLGLVIFAEFFCSILVLLGVMTRAALVPLVVTMAVAVFSAHSADIFGKGEPATLYLLVYIALLLTGPGGYSVDARLSGR